MKRTDLNKAQKHGEVKRATLLEVKRPTYTDTIKKWVVIFGASVEIFGYNPNKETIVEVHISKWEEGEPALRHKDGKWLSGKKYLSLGDVVPKCKYRELTKKERFIAHVQGLPCELEEE